jgi:hypothetical protein
VVKAVDEFRIDALKDLQEFNVRRSTLQAKLDPSKDKLAVAGAPRLVQTEAVKPKVQIFRKTGGEVEKINGTVDFELIRGDVIEVSVPTPETFGLTSTQADATLTR